MKVKTKSGFACEVNENKIKDWRFIKGLAKCDSSDESAQLEGITFVIPFLFGEKGEDALMKHLADKDGVVSTADVINEFKEVLIQLRDGASSKETKKS